MARTPNPADHGPESARGGRKRSPKPAAKASSGQAPAEEASRGKASSGKASPGPERPLAFEPAPDEESVASAPEAVVEDRDEAEVRAPEDAPEVRRVKPARRRRPSGERRYLIHELFD